jgi:drug/metabolite transporter (DMT)-like permease
MPPLVSGALLALASAIAFGATAPLIARAGSGAGPWTIAALLYAGAVLATLPTVRPASRERRVTWPEYRRIALTGVLGAMLAPAALAWGIARSGALSASLVLALESVFTVAIAALVFHEHVGRRVTLAALLIAGGAGTLVVANGGGGGAALGIAAVAAATLLWAIDNALTGTVAGADPSSVVVLKGATGIAGSVAFALLAREAAPPLPQAAALVAVGAVGFGASLRWYLLAQRRFGVARTASLFATAPFAGAAIAYALGERAATPSLFALAAVLIAAGIGLHIGERHEHAHVHPEHAHEHAHTHDDGHHEHDHEEPPPGSHSHPHRHPELVHAHAHAPDEHHVHVHRHPGNE